MKDLKDLKIKQLEDKLVLYKLKELAQDSIGAYRIRDKVRTLAAGEANLQMQGHNAALALIVSNREDVSKWFQTVPDVLADAISTLVLADAIKLEVGPELIRPYVHVDDIFTEGPDIQDLKLSELSDLSSAFTTYGWAGVFAYVSHKRGVKPMGTHAFEIKYPLFVEALTWIGRQ